MVAIVSGNSLGLNLTSLATLGQQGVAGSAAHGRNGQAMYVNVANGNLVLQQQDELLVARGHDAAAVRSYNSQGLLTDDNADNWSNGAFAQPLQLSGTLNTAGSTVSRTDRDGAVATYAYDSALGAYVTTDGGGAHDTITFIVADNQMEWRDGSTGVTQRYEAGGAWRLLSSRDTSGNALAYSYGATGLLASVTTASGETTFYDYSGNNLTQVRSVTAGGTTSTVVRYGYDATNRLASVTLDLSPADNSVADARVYQTLYTYDGTSTRVATVTQGDGVNLAFTYVAVGTSYRVATVTDALNQVTRFTYSLTAGAPGYTTVTDPLNFVTRFDVDAAGRLTTITGPSTSSAFTYNASGDVTGVTDGEGRTVSYGYDAQSNQVLQRDALGNTVTRTFDSRNQLVTETKYLQPDPDGADVGQPTLPLTTRYVYDTGGRNQLRFVISAEGRVTEYRYNGFGERVSSIGSTGSSFAVAALSPTASPSELELVNWSAAQNLALTQRVDTTYDARGQAQTSTSYAKVSATGAGVEDGSQSVQRFVHDQRGNLLQSIAPGAGSTTHTYDGAGRVLTSTDALGQVSVTQYNDAARKTVVTLSGGLVSTSVFDAANRLVSVLHSDAAAALLGETRYFYDAAGQLRMTQDPTGVRNWMLYDAAGRKAADIDANGTLTEYVYDRNGRVLGSVRYETAVATAGLVTASGTPVLAVALLELRPPAGNGDIRRYFVYDAAGRLVKEARSIDVATWEAVSETRYDGASRASSTIDYASRIDILGIGPDVSVPVAATNAEDRIARSFYDADGLLKGTLDAEGYLSTFAYDGSGRLVERIGYSTPTQSTLRATGSLAQLLPAASAADIRSDLLYDGKGQLIAEVDGEGYLTETVYDVDGNVTQNVRYATRVTATVSAGSTVGSIRPVSTANDRTTTRTFDALGRLVQETSADGVISRYAYDTAGRVTSTTRAAASTEVRTLLARYDFLGRLVGELSAEGAALLTGGQTQAQVDAVWARHGSTHSYDAAGRRTATTNALGQKTWFFYNVDGALTHTVNALGEVHETRYDALGRTTDQITYGTRIATAGLAGGLTPATFTSAVAALANATADSRAQFTYTRDSKVASTTDALGNLTLNNYTVFGDLVGSSQAIVAGQTLVHTHLVDRRGQRVTTLADTTGVNAATSALYDAFGRQVRSVDALGNVRETSYDKLGRVVTTRDAANSLRSTAYDAFARVLTQTDALGRTTTYTYDAVNRSMSMTTAEGIVTTTVYTRHGQVLSVSDGRGQVTSYSYDRNGGLVETTTPLTTSSSSYDAAGNRIETVDANGNKVSYGYDAANRLLTRRVDPAGLNLTTTFQYDAKGQQISVTDANGFVRATEYDLQGQVLKQKVDPDGLNLQTVYSYDAKGRVVTVTSPGATLTRYVYDALGRRTQEAVDPSGLNLRKTWTYDASGNVLSSTDPLGNVTRYAYDAEGRLLFKLDPLGNLQQTTYDAEGRVTRTVAYATAINTSGLGASITAAAIQPRIASQAAQDVVEHRVYDQDGRLAGTVSGIGAVTSYQYDANGNVVSRRSYATALNMANWVPGSVPAPPSDSLLDDRTLTVYDQLNRALYTLDGIGAVVARSYDGSGNVVQQVGYASAIPTDTAATQATIAAAISNIADPGRDASVRNTYDAAGRLTWSVDGTGAVKQRTYDKNGNLVRQVAYATSITAAAGASTVPGSASDRIEAYAYDGANRLVLKVDPLKAVTELAHDRNSNVTRKISYATPIAALPILGVAGSAAAIRGAVLTNAAADRSTWYGYDAANRQAVVIDALGAATETSFDGAGQVSTVTAYAVSLSTAALGFAPTLAAMKALVQADSADRTQKFAYDSAGRLVYSVDAARAVTYTQFDGVGRTTRTARYHGLIAADVPPTAAAIAAAAAAIADSARDQVQAYSYNAAGQLIASTDAMGATESYRYDALGRKVAFVNKKGSEWTYGYDASGRLMTETTPLVFLTAVTASSGNLIAGTPAEVRVTTRNAYDALGNVTQRIEAAGRSEQRVTQYEYDGAGRQVRVIHPGVNVYDAAGDAVTTNGASGVAARVEGAVNLETRTFYDALGNAVANRDVGGGVSQKVYDLLGRVLYEVDALGYVTAYARNAFGEVTTLTRYGAVNIPSTGPITQASDAVTKSGVEAALSSPPSDGANFRKLFSAYDRAGRVIELREPVGFFYDSAANLAATAGEKTTRNTYDAFGQLVQEKVLRAGDVWSSTTHYFDKAGRETAVIDALGHLTQRDYDTLGNVAQTREFAAARAAGSWTTVGYGAVAAPAGDDRVVTYEYDRLNRKLAETRVLVEYGTAAGSSQRGNVRTAYGYDALGNQTSATDAEGNTTYTSYDALGRVSAVAAPTRNSTVSGAQLTPLTAYRRDANGNVVAAIEYANGASSAIGFTPLAVHADDRTTVSAYDVLGRVIQTTDANSSSEFFSYDAQGNVAKTWRGVTGSDGITRTLFEVSAYDKLGQLVETRSPASTSLFNGATVQTITQAAAGVITTRMEYDAYGQMTRRGTEGGRQEYFDYDTAGRLWRTNTGDGVDRIQLFDLQGNVTSEIRSSGSGREDYDIKGVVNAAAAHANPYTRRVDIKYDALGRVTEKAEAARQELQGGVSVQRAYAAATVVRSAAWVSTDQDGLPVSRDNEVALQWSGLAALGSGDIKVYIEYRTVVREAPNWYLASMPMMYIAGGTPRSYASAIFQADAAANGATLTWTEAAGTTDTGVGEVTRIVVYKKDLAGGWNAVIDQAPGYGANYIDVAAPANLNSGLGLELRAAGSSADTGWWAAGLVNYGDAYRFDARALGTGSFEYRVKVAAQGEGTVRTTGTGTVSLTQPPLNVISTPITYGQAGTGVLSWQTPGVGYQQVLRFRLNGSTGGWSTLPITRRGDGYLEGADTTGLGAGNYQFELLWTQPGYAAPSHHATGTFTVTAARAAYWVPPVNLANITGLTIGTAHVGGTFLGIGENGPMYSGGSDVPALVWNAAGADTVRYRAPGGAWNYLPIDNMNQVHIGAYLGSQKAALNGLPPGSYEVQILVGSPPTAQATGNLVVYAQSAGYYQTIYVQVPVSQPVIAYYQPVYETRYGWRLASYQAWVADPPYIVGYQENGTPVYAYPGHYETRYYWESYAYQVQVGSTPVYATNEDGSIVYQTVWVTQAQQQWVPGTTPTPTISVTTPPYTAGYMVAAVPTQYSVNVTTAPGSLAMSTGDGSVMGQNAGVNGDSRWLRPTVQQKTDRWGNVTEITDPRSAYWKTTYKYNHLNLLVQQTQPDASGGASAGSPVTTIYYDKLGRQVAVRDANGNVNGQVFDSAGNLVEEKRADLGAVTHRYDAFGQKVKTTDANGNDITFSYDKMGHTLRVVKGQAGLYRVNSANALEYVATPLIADSWTYDQLGRKLTQTNGNGQTLSYAYDLRSNLVETRQPLGQSMRAAFDAQGRKTAEVDANGRSSTWSYDYFGSVTGHRDLGGATYTYAYDNARQLIHQASSRGQSISISYDAAGQVTTIRDWANDKRTTYQYDLSGRRIRERVVQGGVTYQDNHLAYDAQGRLRDVSDARVHVAMQYDKMGNRTWVGTFVNFQGVGGEAASATNKFFKYDAMNRQVVVDAVDAAFNIGTQGHVITYDGEGNRKTDTFWGNKVVATSGQPTIIGYDENVAIYGTTPTAYVRTTGTVKETYRYDALNRLVGVERDGIQIDVRHYDGADRVVQSGPAGNLPAQFAQVLNEGLLAGQTNGNETRINRYDANGRLLHQRILKSDNGAKLDLSWDPAEVVPVSGGAYVPDGYDAAGNSLGYVMQNHEAGQVTEFSTALTAYEGYREGVTAGVRTGSQGTSTQQYDVNGFLVGFVDSTQGANNRTFVNDANGVALFVNQAGNVQRQLIANGEALGIYGAAVDTARPSSGNPNFANLVDFDFGYSRITSQYPNASPGAYQVRTGDTLQSIAQSAYGDSSLWYRVAEANGLGSSRDLKVGQTLNIPNRVSTVSNNASTFKPYDPSKINGDFAPNMPVPASDKGGCGGIGKLLMIVVAIVVTIYTAGTLTPGVTGGFSSTMAAGAGVVGGSGAAAGTALGTIGTLAVASAAGSMASQVVGLATGTIQQFDWKGVALSALGGGISGALPTQFMSGLGATGAAMARAGTASFLTQGVAVTVGLQKKFDWRSVAASAVGAGVGQVVGEALRMNSDAFRSASFGEQIGKRLISGLAAGAATAVARGGKVSAQQVAVDAFGNALGSSLAGAASGDSTRERLDIDYENEMDRQSDAARRANAAGAGWAADMAARRQALDPLGIRAMASDSASVVRRAGLLWGPIPAEAAVGALSDLSSDGEIAAQHMREAGYDGAMVPTAGSSVRVTPGMGVRPPMVNGISVNQRAESAFQLSDDLAGMAGLYRDYKLLGGLMGELQQQATLDRLKGALQDKLGVMRVMPSPDALGAVPGIDSDGAVRYNNADLIDRYADALRKVGMWKQGIIEVDTGSMLITSIGNQRMSPTQWVEENTQRYLRAYAAGLEDGQARYARGMLPFKADMPEQLQTSIWAHQRAELAIKGYNLGLGVPEGPGQLLSMNRWSYDPGGSGMTMRNDMLLDLGPNRSSQILRFVVDGKSSLTEATVSRAQLERASSWHGGASVKAATPQGLWPLIPRKGR